MLAASLVWDAAAEVQTAAFRAIMDARATTAAGIEQRPISCSRSSAMRTTN